MKNTIFIVFVLCVGMSVSAQIDNPSGFGTPIPASETNSSLNSPLLKPSETPGMSNTNTFKPRNEATKPLKESEEKNFDMSTDNGLQTKKFDYKPSWLTKDAEFRSDFYSNQKFGTFGTKSKTIEILCRDHQYVDGDRVNIHVNGIMIIGNVNLRSDFQSFMMDLQPGSNLIEIEALNQGSSGPNTAHFKVYDENSTLLTENVWNLATGVKAILVVIQED